MNFFKSDITDEDICEFIKDYGKVVTPDNICWDMITLVNDTTDFFKRPEKLDEEYINNHRVLDIYCQSGNIVINCVKYFIKALYPFFDTLDDLVEFIYKNLIYAVCPTDIIRCAVASRLYDEINIDSSNLFIRDENTIPEEIKDMKFDLVVGNPPYNGGIYLDFVTKGHRQSKGYSLWITPPKGIDSLDFSNCISDVVFFPSSRQIWDSIDVRSICYYLISNTPKKYFNLVTKASNSSSIKTISSNLDILDARYVSIVDKFRNLKDTYFNSISTSLFGRLQLDRDINFSSEYSDEYCLRLLKGKKVLCYIPYSAIKSSSLDIIPMYKLVCSKRQSTNFVTYILNPYEICDNTYVVLSYSDDLSKVESAKSYFDTSLIQFLTTVDIRGTTKDEFFWRFVPKPDAFDHIFINNELYKKYSLTDEEISIIESVIKERS